MIRFAVVAGSVALAVFNADAARADPCEGPLPSRAGTTFSGTVRYVVDGDGLCVGASADPATWVEVRLADFNAPELRERDGPQSREMLRRLVFGREVSCVSTRGRSGRVISYDRVIATCRLNGRRLGDLLRASRAPEGGN